MILREYTDKDKQGKNRLFLDIECDNCKKTYKRHKRFYTSQYDGCSPLCLSILKGSRVFVDCAHCGKSTEKKASALNNSKSGLYFCNRECKEAAQTYMKAIMPDHYGTGGNYRAAALKHYGASCQRCGYSKNIAAIHVHHVDRNRNNNDLNNLEVLCANCHAIEHWGT